MRKMIRLFLVAIFAGVQCAFAIEIHAPVGWSDMEVPSKIPS
jgi:hypothetical protein